VGTPDWVSNEPAARVPSTVGMPSTRADVTGNDRIKIAFVAHDGRPDSCVSVYLPDPLGKLGNRRDPPQARLTRPRLTAHRCAGDGLRPTRSARYLLIVQDESSRPTPTASWRRRVTLGAIGCIVGSAIGFFGVAIVRGRGFDTAIGLTVVAAVVYGLFWLGTRKLDD
jgi:hypothetical protein